MAMHQMDFCARPVINRRARLLRIFHQHPTSRRHSLPFTILKWRLPLRPTKDRQRMKTASILHHRFIIRMGESRDEKNAVKLSPKLYVLIRMNVLR